MKLTTGYLKCTNIQSGAFGKPLDLQRPNLEIMQLFTREIAQNLTGYGGVSDVINMMEEIYRGNIV